MSNIKAMRTRWRRWLGQKTRIDKPYWTTLLDGNWRGWVSRVHQDKGTDVNHTAIILRPELKSIFLSAINIATMEELWRLDMLYCEDKEELSG